MTRTRGMLFCGAIALLALGQSAEAAVFNGSVFVNDRVIFDGVGGVNPEPIYGGGAGGEFLMQVGLAGPVRMITFCLERTGNENIRANMTSATPTQYRVYNISGAANRGGTAANGGGANNASTDPISKGTGWLYEQFFKYVTTGDTGSGLDDILDTLPDGQGLYNRTISSRTSWAKALQAAIWRLEDEVEDADYSGIVSGNDKLRADRLYNKVVALYGDDDTEIDPNMYDGAKSNYEGGAVKALNITTNMNDSITDPTSLSTGSLAQSQVIIDEGGIFVTGSPIPEPMTMVIWSGLAAAGLVAAKFRRRK